MEVKHMDIGKEVKEVEFEPMDPGNSPVQEPATNPGPGQDNPVTEPVKEPVGV
jgi:hypothetical protein